MSLSFAATVFSQPNFQGQAMLVGVGTNDRYNPISSDQLKGQAVYGTIRSVDLFGSDIAESNLILFGNDDFSGAFFQMSDARSGGASIWNTTGHAGSMLLVAGKKPGKNETRISFREQFLNQWDTFLDEKLGGTKASRVGDPTLTWEMFPANVSYLDPSLTYLKIYQPLHISIPWWPDYSASMTYHIYLYIDGNHHLKGWGARWECWVEGGAKNGKIHDSLDPQVSAGLSALQDQINAQFALLDLLGPLSDVYYLPGNQLTDVATGSAIGHTTDDITIVVEH